VPAWGVAAAVFALALLINAGVAWRRGMTAPMQGDAVAFKQIAQNLVSGNGYRPFESPWPDRPTMVQSPGWPFLLGGVFKCLPAAKRGAFRDEAEAKRARVVHFDIVMRGSAIAVNSAAAAVLALLAFRLFGRPSVAVLSGAVYAAHPVALAQAYSGLSEPLLILLAVSGILLLLSERRRHVWLGFLLLGCAGLVAPRFLAWLVPAALLGTVVMLVSRRAAWKRLVLAGSLGIVLALVPSLGWALRNFMVCHRFPVLNTSGGQAFYGGNNLVVASNSVHWGSWVNPDTIPEETALGSLAKTKSEYFVDLHYYKQGKAYVSKQLSAMPRLWLGKLARAYLPVIWDRSGGSWGVSAYRWLLYGIGIAGANSLWRRKDWR